MKQRDVGRPEPRHDIVKSHLVAEHRHDPYKARGKLPEPTMCPQCKAVFESGRWQWRSELPSNATLHDCPACQRTSDRFPAGELTLSGPFLTKHADAIINLARNVEAAESREHPLQRIMAIERASDQMVITTTDIHLPRRIGHAIEKAHKGELTTHYDEAGYFVRMTWSRAA